MINEKLWMSKFNILTRYVEKQKGKCYITRNDVIEGVNIGTWLAMQRKKMEDGTILPYRGQKLEELWNKYPGIWLSPGDD